MWAMQAMTDREKRQDRHLMSDDKPGKQKQEVAGSHRVEGRGDDYHWP